MIHFNLMETVIVWLAVLVTVCLVSFGCGYGVYWAASQCSPAVLGMGVGGVVFMGFVLAILHGMRD